MIAALQLPRAQAQLAVRALARPSVALATLITTSTIVRSAIAWRHSTARYFADEYIYMELGRSIGHGHLMVRDHVAHFPALLEPLLAAPIWRLFPFTTAYHLVQTENALALSLAAIPVYLLARRVGLDSGYSLLCSVYAVVVPATVMVAFTITDFVAYPLALAAILAAVRALDAPSAKRQLAFVGFMALATGARTQYFVLAPAYLVAAFALERRAAFRLHRTALLAFAPAVAAVLVAATGYFSVWFASIPLGWRDISQPALQVFLLSAVTGVALVPGTVVGLWRVRDPKTKAFALMVGTFIVLLIAEISVFSANTLRFKERYLFPVMPLLAIGFGVYRKRGYPHRWAVFLMSVALAIAASRAPVSAYATGADRFDSESLSALEWLQGSLGVVSTSVLAAVIITVGAAGAVAVALLRRGGLSLPFAIGLALATTVIATQSDLRITHAVRRQYLPADTQWIEHAAGGKAVTAIATPLSSASALALQLYWNPDVNRVLLLDDGEPPDAYATEGLQIAADGVLKNVRNLFFFDTGGTRAAFTNATRVARTGQGELLRPIGVPHFRTLIEGIGPDGWLIAGGRIRAWPLPSAAHGTRAQLSFTASVPKNWPGIAILRIGSGKWYIDPGKPTKISCTSSHRALDVIYRSPSTIFNPQGNPASVRLSQIRVRDVAPSTQPGPTTCVRVS